MYFQWEMPSGHTSQDVKPAQIKQAAVIGAGTMGAGIVVTLLNAGILVIIVEQNQKVQDVTHEN